MSSAEKIVQALAVTAELTGTQLSETAQAVMAEDLMAYPLDKVLAALTRCRRELTGRLSLAAILERVDDGWPGADEALNGIIEGWRNECLTVITTETARLAAGEAYALYQEGDKYGARMAFKGAYERMVSEAKAKGLKPDWVVSAGTDKLHLEKMVTESVQAGRLAKERALLILPAGEKREELRTGLLLTDEQRQAGRERLAPMLKMLTSKAAIPDVG